MSTVKINDFKKGQDPETNEEVLIFDPYNPVNKEITEEEVRGLLTRFGIPESVPIHNMALYRRAFVHRSYVRKSELDNMERNVIIVPKPDDCMALKTKSNDRLEFVGDGVLECITKYYLYERFPKSDEGFMTDTKIALVRNDAIGQLALDIGLNKWYIISKNAEQKNTRMNVKKLGNLFEAFLGAMFLDFNKVPIDEPIHDIMGLGFQLCQKWLIQIFETPGLVPWHRIIETNENYKNQLQVIVQKEFKTVPLYLELGDSLETGEFRMGVFLSIGNHRMDIHEAEPVGKFKDWQQVHDQLARRGFIFIGLGEGTNKIKKKAEQAACKMALEWI